MYIKTTKSKGHEYLYLVKMSFSRIQQALNHAMVAVLPSAYYHGKALYLNNHKPWRDVAAARKL
ncbi:MAG: hypothetical protein ROM54_00005, partial [Anaerobiospirillum sp.]|nr:hypothetical protein [Anaerobiospirillum sp.]